MNKYPYNRVPSLKYTALVVAICLIGMLISSKCQAQKIQSSEYDEFIKAKKIQTSFVHVASGMNIGIRSVNESILLQVAGSGNYVVGDDSPLMILLTNGRTIEVKSKGIQTSTVYYPNTAFQFEYYISKNRVEELSREDIKSIRFYSVSGYYDSEVKKKTSEKLNNLAKIFLEEFNKVKTLDVTEFNK